MIWLYITAAVIFYALVVLWLAQYKIRGKHE